MKNCRHHFLCCNCFIGYRKLSSSFLSISLSLSLSLCILIYFLGCWFCSQEMSNSCEDCGLEEKMGSQKISVSDHTNGFQYTADKSDNFVIDMDSFSHPNNKDITANSRITVSFSYSSFLFLFFLCGIIFILVDPIAHVANILSAFVYLSQNHFLSLFFFFLVIVNFLVVIENLQM